MLIWTSLYVLWCVIKVQLALGDHSYSCVSVASLRSYLRDCVRNNNIICALSQSPVHLVRYGQLSRDLIDVFAAIIYTWPYYITIPYRNWGAAGQRIVVTAVQS